MNNLINRAESMKYIIAVIVFSLLVGFLTRWSFYTSFGPLMADIWAFIAGMFLVSEGVWRMLNSIEKRPLFQCFRLLRISAGICMFTIHLLQVIRDGKMGI